MSAPKTFDASGATALVTGANQGIGLGFVEALLARGVRRIYAGARRSETLDALAELDPEHVRPLLLDVTDAGHCEQALAQAGDVTLLINNAGIPGSSDAAERRFLSATDMGDARSVFETDFWAPVRLCRLFAPRIVAFGDVHGDLQATLAALRLAGAIAPDGESWIGGALVLVQTGDQLDRGDDERAILELFDRLAKEAAAAGGAFHILNGNHELMNAAGDLRYVTPGGFADFARVPGLKLNDPRFASAPEVVRPRLAAFAPGGPYARMLATRPTVLVVGDTVFAHGGVLPEHVSYGLEKINQEVQRWLLGQVATPPAITSGENSPVWTRDYSMAPDAEDCATLDRALAAIPAKRMVVGHTVQIEGVKSACDGKVWLVDVGMAKHYGGSPAVIEIVGDTVNVLR